MDHVFKAYLACQNKEELDAIYLSCKSRDAQDMALTALSNETARLKEIAVKEESPITQPNTMTDRELVNAYKQLKNGFTSYKFNVDAPEAKQMIAFEKEMNRRGLTITYLLDDIDRGLKTLRTLIEDDFSPVSALLELQRGDNWEGRQDAWQAILDAAVNAGIVTPEDIERAAQRDAYAEIFLTPAPENDPPANYDERKQAFDEKRERRINRLQTCAANAEKRSDQLWAAGHKLVENIPFGQPILVGHHSEKHHRRTIERAQNKSSQAVEEHKKADYYAARADAAENNHAISSDDPDACDKLQAKIDDAEKLQVMMVMINKIVRAKKLTDDQKIAQLIAQGIRLDVAQGALEKDYLGRVGIPAYKLQNNSANIRRMKDRLQDVKKQEARPAGEMEINGVRIVENDIENRVQIFFIVKPAENVREYLKHNGFHWSKFNGAWQRMRSNVATRTAQEAAQMVNAE
jgi:hypothetical protein